MMRPDLFWKLVRFGVVGVAVMLFFMGMNWLLAHWMSEQWAFLAAYPAALGLHFALNKWWTFGCRRADTVRQVSEYLTMAALTFLVQWAIFSLVLQFTAAPNWLAAGIANVAQMSLTFLLMNRRVFAASQPAK